VVLKANKPRAASQPFYQRPPLIRRPFFVLASWPAASRFRPWLPANGRNAHPRKRRRKCRWSGATRQERMQRMVIPEAIGVTGL